MRNDYSDFKAGVYRHYKGQLYLTIGLAHDSNDESRTAVIYVPLEFDGAKSGPRLAVRTYEDFYAWVNPYTGEGVKAGAKDSKPRFEYLGPTAPES